MHAENLKRRADMGDDKPKGNRAAQSSFATEPGSGLRLLPHALPSPAGFLLFGRPNENVEMVSLSWTPRSFRQTRRTGAVKARGRSSSSPDDFASRANFDFESRFPGFACVSAGGGLSNGKRGRAWRLRRVRTQKDAIRLTLYVSTSNATAPSALTQAAKATRIA